MVSLNSRWLDETKFREKCNSFPKLKFCNYSPPPPEEHLRCSDISLAGGRCYVCKSIENYYYSYEVSLWNKTEDYTPPDREEKIAKKSKFGRGRINVEIYMELVKNGVKVCSFMERDSEMGCGKIPPNGHKYCETCSNKTGDVSEKVFAYYVEKDYN